MLVAECHQRLMPDLIKHRHYSFTGFQLVTALQLLQAITKSFRGLLSGGGITCQFTQPFQTAGDLFVVFRIAFEDADIVCT